MRKTIKYGTIALVAIAISALIWLLQSPPVVSQSTVKIQTEPPLENIVPDETVVKFQIQALGTAEQSLPNANIQVRILTPAPNPWFTSDFPIVEGTELLNLEAIAPQGNLEFEQVLPIRGNYNLQVVVTPQVTGQFEPFEESLSFRVPENSVKYRNLAILAVILLIAGFGSGWVLGADRVTGEDEIAPQPVRMLLSGITIVAIAVLLVVNLSAEVAASNVETGEVSASLPAVANNQEVRVELLGDRQAVVGNLATQAVKITSAATGEPIQDVGVSLQSVALESDALMFAYQGTPDATGKLTWQEQFFDGAPHSVTATVAPLANSSRSFTPLEVSQEIEVVGIAPPLSVRFISLFYFTSIFAIGLIAGFLGKRNTQTISSF